MHGSDNSLATLIAFGLVFFGLYFMPSLIANGRKHHNTNAITLTNMFFGWTVLGWLGCLIWAFSSTRTPVVVARVHAAATSPPASAVAAPLRWPTLITPQSAPRAATVRGPIWSPRRLKLIPIIWGLAVVGVIGTVVWMAYGSTGTLDVSSLSSTLASSRAAPRVSVVSSSPLPSTHATGMGVFAGPFGEPAVMASLFAQYDRVTHSVNIGRVHVSIPNPNAQAPYEPYGATPGVLRMDSRFDARTSNGLRRVVLFKTVPAGDEFECHACAPVLGYAVFKEDSGGWKAESFEPLLEWDGGRGKLPKDISWLASGPNTAGLLIHEADMHQGEPDESFELVHPTGPTSSKVVFSWSSNSFGKVKLGLAPADTGPDHNLIVRASEPVGHGPDVAAPSGQESFFSFNGTAYVLSGVPTTPVLDTSAQREPELPAPIALTKEELLVKQQTCDSLIRQREARDGFIEGDVDTGSQITGAHIWYMHYNPRTNHCFMVLRYSNERPIAPKGARNLTLGFLFEDVLVSKPIGFYERSENDFDRSVKPLTKCVFSGTACATEEEFTKLWRSYAE